MYIRKKNKPTRIENNSEREIDYFITSHFINKYFTIKETILDNYFNNNKISDHKGILIELKHKKEK